MVVFCGTNLAAVKNFGEFEFWFAALKVARDRAVPGAGRAGDRRRAARHRRPGHRATSPVTAASCPTARRPGHRSAGLGLRVRRSGDGHHRGGRVRGPGARRRRAPCAPRCGASPSSTSARWPSSSRSSRGTTRSRREEGPYVAVLDHLGIPGAGQIMNVVVLVALLSAMNANIYGSSRMAYSLVSRGQGPAVLGRVVGRRPAPRRPAVLRLRLRLRAAELLAARRRLPLAAEHGRRGRSWSSGPSRLSQLRMRRRLEREAPEKLAVRMWAFPCLTWVALAGIVGDLRPDGRRRGRPSPAHRHGRRGGGAGRRRPSQAAARPTGRRQRLSAAQRTGTISRRCLARCCRRPHSRCRGAAVRPPVPGRASWTAASTVDTASSATSGSSPVVVRLIPAAVARAVRTGLMRCPAVLGPAAGGRIGQHRLTGPEGPPAAVLPSELPVVLKGGQIGRRQAVTPAPQPVVDRLVGRLLDERGRGLVQQAVRDRRPVTRHDLLAVQSDGLGPEKIDQFGACERK